MELPEPSWELTWPSRLRAGFEDRSKIENVFAVSWLLRGAGGIFSYQILFL